MSDLSIDRALMTDVMTISRLCRRAVEQINTADYPVNELRLICQDHSFEQFGLKLRFCDVFVARQGGVILGTVSYSDAMVQALFVDPPRGRSGIGTHLMNHIEAHAMAQGEQTVRLSASLTAVPFYERLGYQKQHFEIRPYGSTWHMQKHLKRPAGQIEANTD